MIMGNILVHLTAWFMLHHYPLSKLLGCSWWDSHRSQSWCIHGVVYGWWSWYELKCTDVCSRHILCANASPVGCTKCTGLMMLVAIERVYDDAWLSQVCGFSWCYNIADPDPWWVWCCFSLFFVSCVWNVMTTTPHKRPNEFPCNVARVGVCF